MTQIEEDENEIAYLEKKLGLAGNEKKKNKVNKQWKMEGMGEGFMEFVEGLSGVVKGTKNDWEKKEHDFLDDAKEVDNVMESDSNQSFDMQDEEPEEEIPLD